MDFTHLKMYALKKIPLLFLGFLLFIFSNFTFAAYTFTSTGSASGAPGCTGNASGVYTCTSGLNNTSQPITINNSAGPVTINITGAMRVYENITINSASNAVTFNITTTLEVGNYTIGSSLPNNATNVNIVVGGNTTIAAATIIATIRASSSGSITMNGIPTIYGSLITTSGSISAYGAINGSLVSTTGAITKDGGSVSEAIISTSGQIQLINQTTVKHITCDCALTVGYGVTVTGNIQVASMTEDGASTGNGSQNNYNGGIYTTTGGVKLNFSSDVTGSITSATTVNLSNQNTVNSCVKSTSSSTITLAWGVNANSVCCGGSCSNSCVSKDASLSMPPACTTEQVVINARGDQFYGTYPIMELWVNGTKLGSVSVTGTAKDYFFNVALPATITSLDVVFPNDEANSSGDRNLYLYSLTIRGKTLKPTDAGVVLDKGDSTNYSTFFDGTDKVAGQEGVFWEAAVRFVPSFTGELIASYHLDETSWDGTTNETKDSAGYTGGPFDGQGIGSPKPTASTTSPARSGVSGTCGYASFTGTTSGGSAFTFDGLPVSTTTGAKTSVSFWMYWDGNTWKMPVGWNKYNLVFGDTYFGFNTSNSDLYGMNSTGLANGWHHVVAIFTNGNVTSNKIYIDGVNKSLSQKLGSPANQHALVQSTVQIGGWTNPDWETTNYRFNNSRIDEIKIYNGEISSTQVTADYNATHSCTTDATLIAYHAMDEASWNGTSGELKDTAGYSGGPFNGTGIGTPKPTAATSSPARSGVTGTCGYATFSGNLDGGSAFTIPNLPVTTTAGAKTSVSFWMYWDGTNIVMPIGWNRYDLWFLNGSFGFNTDESDIYGISSTGLENGWHHVVAVFTNGDFTSNKIYIDGVNKTLTQRIGTSNNINAVVQSTLQISGYGKITSFRFPGGKIDEVKVYNREITQSQVTADYNATHACPIYVSNVNANSFNCIAAQESNVGSGRLYTQLAGNAFGIKVIALKAGGTAAETSFSTAASRDVTLKFIDQTNSNAITFNDGSDKTAKTLTFPAGDTTGVLSVNGLTINNAYKNLKCQIVDATATTPTSLSNDSFSVRPYQFTVSSTNALDSSGTSVSNTQKIIAGANFNLRATAVNVAGTTLTGYNGTPSVTVGSITPHTGAIATGTLGGSFSSAASSGVASANFTYSEVGYFKLNAGAVTDTGFIATVDSAANGDCTDDFSVTAVAGKYGCKIQNISESSYFGRFIPERFNVDDASVTSANACGSFNYYGQDGFNTQFILRAQNMSGVRTRNYHGSYAKLDINTWTDDSAPTGLKFLATNLPSGVNLLAGTSSPTGSWSQGQATIYATHKLSRPSSAVAPVNLILKTNPLDSDGVFVINNTPEAANIPANSLFRYGRLWVPNQYGSELLNLTLPVDAQYWDGSTYRRNQLDSCTAIAPANIAMGSYKGNLAACETVISGGGTMSSGKTTMTLSKPGNGNNGSVDLSINLNSAAGSTCTSSTASSATNANLPQFGTSNPTARETFGLFKSPVIYMRENY